MLVKFLIIIYFAGYLLVSEPASQVQARHGGAQEVHGGGGRGNGRPRKPIEVGELEKAKKIAAEKGLKEPFTKACLLKCELEVPYGAADYCPNFRAKHLGMKHDNVKRLNMCRKCLCTPNMRVCI